MTAVIPLPPPRERAVLAPFRVPSFRFQWPADLLISWAGEMENLILGWYVLVATGSVLLLTLFASLQYLGTLIAPMLGVYGDRLGCRRMLCLMRAGYAGLALLLMGLGLADAVSPPTVFAVAIVAGLIRPSDIVMRNTLVGGTMPGPLLMRAMALSRTTQDSARIAGALAGAGLFAALGFGLAYVFVAGFYLAGLALTFGVSAQAGIGQAPRRSPWRDLKDGMAYVRGTPEVLAIMVLAFLVNLAAYPLSSGVLVHVARDVYHTDQTGLGRLMAAYAFGALIGSLGLALGGGPRRPNRTALRGLVAWFLLQIGFAGVADAATGSLLLVGIGLAQSLCMVSMSVVLLRATGGEFRGRVMGVRMLAVYGLPIGLTGFGALIGQIGFPATLTLFCVAGLILTLLIVLRWRRQLWRDG
jgi:MFS family permease